MKMNDALKEFIERNINYIEISDWKPLINSIQSIKYNKPVTLSDFFSAMYASGIDPLKDFYTDEIPHWFMRYSDVLTSLEIPDNIKQIGNHAFANNRNLETVILPTSLERIEERAFLECYKLKTCVIPNNIEYIGTAAFADCHGIELIDLSQSLNYLGQFAFAGCKNLKKVTLYPETFLGSMIFDNCDLLKEINWLGTEEQLYNLHANSNGKLRLSWLKGSSVEKIKCLDKEIIIDRFMRS